MNRKSRVSDHLRVDTSSDEQLHERVVIDGQDFAGVASVVAGESGGDADKSEASG
jgi:hypothetical protein